MAHTFLKPLVIISALIIACHPINATNDSTINYRFEWKQTILPAALIATGSIALAPGVIRHASRSITESVIDMRGNHPRIEADDYIQYIPVISAFALGCTGIKARHDLVDRTFIVATSYAAMGLLVNIPKRLVDEKRPSFGGHNSFPSGHTATAFMGAELVRIEYGNAYGAGAYAIATAVGFMRMYNGRHWLSDIVAGAGVGILSARLGEWSCRFWQKLLKRPQSSAQIAVIPALSPIHSTFGASITCIF